MSTLRRLGAYMELAKAPKCCILKCRAPCWTGKKAELEPLIFLLVIKAIIAICGSCGFVISKLQWLVLIPLNFATPPYVSFVSRSLNIYRKKSEKRKQR